MYLVYCLYSAASLYSLVILRVTNADPTPGLEGTEEGEEEVHEVPPGLEEWTTEGVV